ERGRPPLPETPADGHPAPAIVQMESRDRRRATAHRLRQSTATGAEEGAESAGRPRHTQARPTTARRPPRPAPDVVSSAAAAGGRPGDFDLYSFAYDHPGSRRRMFRMTSRLLVLALAFVLGAPGAVQVAFAQAAQE